MARLEEKVLELAFRLPKKLWSVMAEKSGWNPNMVADQFFRLLWHPIQEINGRRRAERLCSDPNAIN